MTRFMKHVGISRQDLIKHCGATLKAGVFFQGFNKDNFMHCIAPPYANTHNAYYYIYGQLIGYGNQQAVGQQIQNITVAKKITNGMKPLNQ